MITIKSARELVCMREAGRIVAKAHAAVAQAIRVGITSLELNQLAEETIIKEGARPAFKGLYGFPFAVCASINEEVVHGFPSLRKLKNGDIISIDIGAEINGYYGDGAATYPVGDVSSKVLQLLHATKESLHKGIAQARAGNRLSDISHAVQTCAEGYGFSVVRDYVGHGIGTKPHEDPQVPNFGRPGRGPRLQAGMTLAIEPMINMGTYEVRTLSDNWTVVTLDAKLSAHFEHTIAITDDQPEILTKM
ncbi:MAG: type I methionyl aminopeptidase [Peptococcaceae bacterium]|nr:type I methionyl aminopeptidase [Candidatus Syntrophopropionicum ammoniitolerans]